MKKAFGIVLLMIVLPSVLFAADPLAVERPHWSLELKGGRFIPAIDNWETYYGRRDAGTYGGSLAYKLLRWVELGVEGRMIRAAGQGIAPLHGTVTGDVKYELAPLNVFVLGRAVFNENQWVVPYAGVGWTRVFYREEITGQGVARGSADGYHARAGIQLVLDGLDPSAAHRMLADYGINHTSLFIEAERVRAMADAVSGGSVDLGGTSFLGGLLFEF